MDRGVISNLKFKLRPPVNLTLVNTTETFQLIRKLILDDHHNEQAIEDAVLKLEQMRYDNGEDEFGGFRPGRPSTKPRPFVALTRGFSVEEKLLLSKEQIKKMIVPQKKDIKQRVDKMIKEVTTGKAVPGRAFVKIVHTFQDIHQVFLEKYTPKRADAWEHLLGLIKRLLFFKKDNLRDVANVLLYVCGFRHPQLVVIFCDQPYCEQFTAKERRKDLEFMLRELSLEDVLVVHVKLNLRTGDALD